MRLNGDGWVRFSELMKFNRLKKLCDDESRVLDILVNKCTLLEVDSKEHRVRRRPERALPRDKVAFARDLLPRTVYVKGFRKDATLDDVQAYFLRCGVEAEAIRMRRRRDAAAKAAGKAELEDEDDEEEEDTKPKDGAGDAPVAKYPFKGSVFASFRSVEEGERFLKAPQASSDPQADEALFDATVQFEKKWKGEYFREKKQATKNKRRNAQSAFETAKKGRADSNMAKEGEVQGERQFERGMLLRITNVPQALLDFNEMKKLFSAANVDIFADLLSASNAVIIRIKRAPADYSNKEEGKVGTTIWSALCTKFGTAPSDDAEADKDKLPVLSYNTHKLQAEVISGEEEDRFWKDLFAKWEVGGAQKQQRKGFKKQMGKRGKRNWNDKGRRNGKKRQRDEDDDDFAGDSGSGDERQKRVKGGDNNDDE